MTTSSSLGLQNLFSIFLEPVAGQSFNQRLYRTARIYLDTSVAAFCLTKIPPLHASNFVMITLVIIHHTNPFFANLLEDYRQIKPLIFIVRVTQISAAVLISKMICSIFFTAIQFQQITRLTLAVIPTSIIISLIIYQTRRHLSAPLLTVT